MMKNSKYGILLLQDSVYSYQKDQIRLEDRILDLYDDFRSVRLNSIKGKDTNDLLQKVRSSHEHLYFWNKSFKSDVPKYVYIMIGLDELKGGASHKWNKQHLEALILELSVYDFEIIFFTAHVRKLRDNQKTWLQTFKNRIRKITSKYHLDCVVLHKDNVEMNRDDIDKAAKKIANHTKKIYAEKIIGIEKPIIKSKPNVLDNVEVIQIKRTRKNNVAGVSRPQKIKKQRESVIEKTIEKIEIKEEPKPKKPKKKGRALNKVGTSIVIDSDKKNLASY